MFSSSKGDDMVECPYNKFHRMLRKRLQPHLIKCRLSYPDAELCKCPFNASHLVPEPEFTHHCTTCPDKALITQYKYNAFPLKTENDKKQDEVDCDENWDDEVADDYDPKKYASQANVIRAHIGDLPSNKKEFRKNERKRLGDCNSSDEEADKKQTDKDLDCMKNEEEKESKWYENHGSSSGSSKRPREESYANSLKNWTKDRQHKDERQDQVKERVNLKRKTPIDNRRRIKPDVDDYSLDEDPYYRTNSTKSHSNSSNTRASYLGYSRGRYNN